MLIIPAASVQGTKKKRCHRVRLFFYKEDSCMSRKLTGRKVGEDNIHAFNDKKDKANCCWLVMLLMAIMVAI